jgi:hypothetical protein
MASYLFHRDGRDDVLHNPPMSTLCVMIPQEMRDEALRLYRQRYGRGMRMANMIRHAISALMRELEREAREKEVYRSLGKEGRRGQKRAG